MKNNSIKSNLSYLETLIPTKGDKVFKFITKDGVIYTCEVYYDLQKYTYNIRKNPNEISYWNDHKVKKILISYIKETLKSLKFKEFLN